MIPSKDLRELPTPEQQQNIVRSNVEKWRDQNRKRSMSAQPRKFTHEFNNVGDKLKGVKL